MHLLHVPSTLCSVRLGTPALAPLASWPSSAEQISRDLITEGHQEGQPDILVG